MNRTLKLLLIGVLLACPSYASAQATATVTPTPTVTATPTVTPTPGPAPTSGVKFNPAALTGAIRGSCSVNPPSLAANMFATTLCDVDHVRTGMACYILVPHIATGARPTIAVTQCEMVNSHRIRLTLHNVNQATRNEGVQVIYYILVPYEQSPPQTGGIP